MSDAIVSWFSNMNGYTAVFFMSMLPIVELRGSIIFAAATDLPYVWAYIISVVGNMIPIPFVILFCPFRFSGAAKSCTYRLRLL